MLLRKDLTKVRGRVRKKMRVWAGNPGVPETFGYIPSLARKVIYFFLK